MLYTELTDEEIWEIKRKDGYDDGIEQGIEQGIEKKALEVAKSLKEKGISIDIIAEATGIPADEILKM